MTPRKLDVCIFEMLEYFLETLDSFSASCGLQWDILLLLRIFYRTDVFTETHGLRRGTVRYSMTCVKIRPVIPREIRRGLDYK